MAHDAQALIDAMWRAFASQDVRAAVLRRRPPGRGDYDVLVHPDDLERAAGLLAGAGTALGWQRIFSRRIANHLHVGLARLPPPASGGFAMLHVDFQDALGRKGFYYAPAAPFVAERVAGDGAAGLPPPVTVTALALHLLLDKGRVPEEDRRLLTANAGTDHAAFGETVLPRDAARVLSDWIRAGAPDASVAAAAAALRRALIDAYPANRYRPAWLRVCRSMRYFGRRRGVLIAFLGPDGAGKSTIIDAVERMAIDGPFPTVSIYMGKRDTFLPTSKLIRMLHRREHERPAAGRAGRQRRSKGGFPAYVKDVAGLLNWMLEQWARYWIQLRPILQQDGVVLADRYAFDLADRPDYSIVHRPAIRQLLARAFPLPDRTYLLWEDPEVLYARKPEWPVNELAAKLERLRAVLRAVPRAAEIRSNRPAEALAAEVLAEIAAVMGTRA